MQKGILNRTYRSLTMENRLSVTVHGLRFFLQKFQSAYTYTYKQVTREIIGKIHIKSKGNGVWHISISGNMDKLVMGINF